MPGFEGALGVERRWPAPAKINRFLHVIGRRADGYHELQTLFQFLEWGDELEIEPADDGTLNLHGSPLPDPQQDLVLRAARALRDASGCQRGARITLHKRIPPGSGLGGGSSDAATTLRVLDRLWQTDLGIDALADIGLQLGADVPVFVRGHAAWAEGVGERLQPAEPPEGWTVLALPDTSIATADVFNHDELPRNTPRIDAARANEAQTRNDCQVLVRRLSPAVDRALDWLETHGPARMSGTGSAVFLDVADRRAASDIRAQAPADLAVHVVRRSNRSPLQVALERGSG